MDPLPPSTFHHHQLIRPICSNYKGFHWIHHPWSCSSLPVAFLMVKWMVPYDMGVSKNRIRVPQNGWFINHGKPYCLMDDLGGKPTILGKPPYLNNTIPYHPWDWYIYLHFVDFYGKCRRYAIHGSYGY